VRQLCCWCLVDVEQLREPPVLTDVLPMHQMLLERCMHNSYCSGECILAKAIAEAGDTFAYALKVRYVDNNPGTSLDSIRLPRAGERLGRFAGVADEDGRMTEASDERCAREPKRAAQPRAQQ
jgi:hypothetical protein